MKGLLLVFSIAMSFFVFDSAHAKRGDCDGIAKRAIRGIYTRTKDARALLAILEGAALYECMNDFEKASAIVDKLVQETADVIYQLNSGTNLSTSIVTCEQLNSISDQFIVLLRWAIWWTDTIDGSSSAINFLGRLNRASRVLDKCEPVKDMLF